MSEMDKKALDEKIKEAEKLERTEKRKKKREKLKLEKVSFFTDFKKFITKGNVLDLAVAVVISTAFNAIVNGLVKYIITPCVTYFTSGVSIEEWEYILRHEVLDAEGAVELAEISIQYGLWLQAIVDFLIIALSVFVAVRLIRSTERKLNAKEIQKQAEEAAKKKAEEDAKAACDERQFNVLLWLFFGIFGEWRWLHVRCYGNIEYETFDYKMMRPLEKLFE